MQNCTPEKHHLFSLYEGQYSAADVSMLTGVSPSNLQHWTNKGYLGEDKVGLGRGARRTYSTVDIEAVSIGKDLTDCGVAPRQALEIAALVVAKSNAALIADMAHIPVGGEDSGQIAGDFLADNLPLMMATVRMGSAPVGEDTVQILSKGRFSINSLFPDMRPAIIIPIGMTKLTLLKTLDAAVTSKPTKRRSTKRVMKGVNP